MQRIKSSHVMKRNPRPRKYASDAERQAAYRSRYPMLEFRAEPNTTETLTRIAENLDINRSELLLSMVKFALANHDWARFGLTHKTLPFYKGNPMASKKTFLMTEKGGNRVETPYDFIFTHYIPMNSYGGSKVAFRFVGQNVHGDVIVSEYESGKKVGQITNYEMIKNHITSDRTAAKKLIENLLMKYGADKVYSVLTKG